MLFRVNRPNIPQIFRSPVTSKMILIGMILTSILIVSGCSTAKPQTNPFSTTTKVDSPPLQTDQSTSNSTPPQANNSSSKTTDQTLTLYFPGPDATGLVPVQRVVKEENQETIKAIFNELASPPEGVDRPLPPGTRLLGAKVENNIATVDLSQEFKKNFVGGSTGEQMALYSIVNSLTGLPNVQAVQFLLEGEKKAAILHEIDTTVPIKRNESLILKK